MKKKVSILLPAFNEEASFGLLEQCMSQVICDNPDYDWEFLLVNDGSSDNTLQLMEKLYQQDSAHYSFVDLSRNYGKEIAMMAGFDYVTGDAVIIMDSDMQHPISVIPEMLSWWELGYDDVYAQRRTSKESFLKRNSSRWYYKILQKLTRIPIQKDTGDFRLLDRTCINALRQMRESERNTKGMYSWIGFHKKGIWYEQLERTTGVTKWNIWSLLNLAINGIMSYTIAPLRIASLMGICVSFFAFAYLIYIIFKTILFGEEVQGYPTLMVTLLLLGGMILLSLGIIGEYLGKIFNETKGRPVYFINSYNGNRQSVK